MSVLNNLKWRYATKRMNGQKVQEEKLEKILEAIQLAPTSIGLQPFTILVIEDADLAIPIAPLAAREADELEDLVFGHRWMRAEGDQEVELLDAREQGVTDRAEHDARRAAARVIRNDDDEPLVIHRQVGRRPLDEQAELGFI